MMPASLTRGIVSGPPPPADRRASFAALLVLLVSTGIVFAALTVAFVARRGLTDDWVALRKPPILWWNTAVLLASSLVLDVSRRALRARRRDRFNLWWSAGTGLGILFLAGQAVAWHQLRQAGVFVASNPSSSFFYVLTAAHALHVLGGVGALVYVGIQAWRLRLGPSRRTAIDVTAVFWHFLDGLWVYLMILFYVWG